VAVERQVRAGGRSGIMNKLEDRARLEESLLEVIVGMLSDFERESFLSNVCTRWTDEEEERRTNHQLENTSRHDPDELALYVLASLSSEQNSLTFTEAADLLKAGLARDAERSSGQKE
jgi:hypothetical protein